MLNDIFGADDAPGRFPTLWIGARDAYWGCSGHSVASIAARSGFRLQY